MSKDHTSKNSCPKCGGDVFWKAVKDGDGYTLGQCTNKDCKVVVHTGAKLCQMNVCEWHEICGDCGHEICGDFTTNNDGEPIHIDGCPDQNELRMREILGY